MNEIPPFEINLKDDFGYLNVVIEDIVNDQRAF